MEAVNLIKQQTAQALKEEKQFLALNAKKKAQLLRLTKHEPLLEKEKTAIQKQNGKSHKLKHLLCIYLLCKSKHFSKTEKKKAELEKTQAKSNEELASYEALEKETETLVHLY